MVRSRDFSSLLLLQKGGADIQRVNQKIRGTRRYAKIEVENDSACYTPKKE